MGVSIYVCLCNGISDKKTRQTVRQFSPRSLQQLKKFIPVSNQCGRYVRITHEVMEDKLMQLPESKKSAQTEYVSRLIRKPFYTSKGGSKRVKK